MLLLGLSDDTITKNDPNFLFFRMARDGLESGFCGRRRIGARDVVLEAAHDEKDRPDHEWPCDESDEKKQLVKRHLAQFGRR
jgi:hypothetical protein